MTTQETQTSGVLPSEPVSPPEILAELERVLSSGRFAKSDRLGRFLRYVVEETAHGRGGQLKETVVAMEAFGREGSFDPRLDATVRVQATRLRAALRDYYRAEGSIDPVEIEIPKGAYVPVFRFRALPPEVAVPVQPLPAPNLPSRMRPAGLAAAGLLLALACGLGIFWYVNHLQALTDKDTIVLADFANSTGDPIFDGTLRQALAVDLEQSPFLNVLSEQRTAQTLRLMGRPAEQRLTEEITRELCQRVGAKAMLAGTIARLGGLYVIGLTASSCATGDTLAQEQARAENKEQVLKAMDRAVISMRRRLGESLASVQEYDTPVEDATTPSLEALQAYSIACKARYVRGDDSATLLPLRRAIEMDSNFAMAHALLGSIYFSQSQATLAAGSAARAFALRNRVSARERLYIEVHYYEFVTGELEKAAEVDEQWIHTYPRDWSPANQLGVIHGAFGNYPKAVAAYREAIRRDPDIAYVYTNLAQALLNLDQPQEAIAVLEEMQRRNLDSTDQVTLRYFMAFLKNDSPGMDQQASVGAGYPAARTYLGFARAGTEAFHGRAAKAREVTQDAVGWPLRSDSNEQAAIWQVNGALREAEFGNPSLAVQQAESALTLSNGKDVRTLAALAFSRAGQAPRARTIAEELKKQFPADTLLHEYWLPSIAASLELQSGNAVAALQKLQPTAPYELGQPAPFQPIQLGPMYPVYLRGQALLASRQGEAAAVEFEKVIDHPGVVLNYPLGALARLGWARALALQNDPATARTAYGEFLALWKGADADLPVLRQAQAEYASLR